MKRIVGVLMGAVIFLSACATTKVDWQTRVGSYTYDQTVLEMGPPDKEAKLTDGTRVCEWLTYRSRNNGGVYVSHWRGAGYVTGIGGDGPDYYLRLTFDPTGKLQGFKKYAK